MANKAVHLPVVGFGGTLRKDAWWAGPAVTAAILLAFIGYATFRAFENDFYAIDPYLSPFYAGGVPPDRRDHRRPRAIPPQAAGGRGGVAAFFGLGAPYR